MAMKLKVIQLNTWFGKYFDGIVEFVEQEKPDVLLMQEVVRGGLGELNHGKAGFYEEIKKRLGYEGVCEPMWRVKRPVEYELGVAIMSKNKLVESGSEFYFKHLVEYEQEPVVGKGGAWEFPGLLLWSRVETGAGIVKLMTTHFVWSLYPEVNDFQRTALRSLLEKLAGQERFVLGGDFNVTSESEIYAGLIKSGLVDDRPIDTKRTIHPTIHRVGEKELAVDFVFHKGEGFEVVDSRVPLVDISDHLPVVVEYEVGN